MPRELGALRISRRYNGGVNSSWGATPVDEPESEGADDPRARLTAEFAWKDGAVGWQHRIRPPGGAQSSPDLSAKPMKSRRHPPSLSAGIPVSYTHLDVYKRQVRN